MSIEERVLIWVRGVSERRITIDLLKRERLEGLGCDSVEHLCALATEGAGSVLLAEEVLDSEALQRLEQLFSEQPAWSDLPVVCFSGEHRVATSIPLRELGNVTFLERPVHVRSMLAAVRAALRSRRRQYEARRAIESRDAFLAMLGHELRNPLAAISFASRLVRNRQEATQVAELEVIERQSAHLSHLVDELLDVARFTHGKVKIKRETIDLRDTARSAFQALHSRALEKGQRYELELPDEQYCSVEGDTQRLQQVFANLLNNAVKYTPIGGQVMMRISSEPGWNVVEVSDNGMGLSHELVGRVFEPFLQADASLHRSEGGLGLGLSVVRSIVELHNGTVEAESPGENLGSTFRVRLPAAVGAAAIASPAEPNSTLRASPAHVLVVEDNDDIRDLFTALLKRGGHRVVCAADGPQGLSQLLLEPPDVAFIDIGLPGFDGLELARRARSSGSSALLIALTGYGQPEDRKSTESAGFDEHLVKPVSDADVQRVLVQAGLRARSRAPDDSLRHPSVKR